MAWGELARRRREKNWVFFAVFKAETVFFRSKNFLAAEGGQKILGVGEGQDGGERGGVFQILEIRIAPPRSGGELGGSFGASWGGAGGSIPPIRKWPSVTPTSTVAGLGRVIL